MIEFLSGCISGLAQNIIGHPFDKKMISNPMNYYRGFFYPTTHMILTTGIVFELNNYLEKWYIKKFNFETGANFFSGFWSGFLTAPSIYIFDVGKVKSQMKIKLKTSDFYKTKGLLMTTTRESIAVSVYLGSYFQLRKNEVSAPVSGGLAGLINWSLTYPIDIIKTRQMTYNISIREAYLMGNLWKGYHVCAIRALVVNSIGFWVYEKSKLNFKSLNSF